MQTSLANVIDTADQEAQYDACVKKLLSEKRILAWILKECVEEFKPYPIEQIMGCIDEEPKVSVTAVDQDELDYLEEPVDKQIEGLNMEDNSIKEGRVYYDIKFSAIVPDTDSQVQLIINVEAQKDEPSSYPLIKRAIYYVSRMISAQKNTVFVKREYGKIRKVYSIWIQMNVDDESEANSITEFSIGKKNVIGASKDLKENYDLMTVVLMRLGNPEMLNDKGILRLLDVLLSEDKQPDEKKVILEKDFDIPMTESMSEEVNIMCNLGEGIRENTVLLTKAQSIIDLMDSMCIDIDKAMQLLKIEPQKKEIYKKKVDELLSQVAV